MIIISRLWRLFVRTFSLTLWRNKITRWFEDINCIISSKKQFFNINSLPLENKLHIFSPPLNIVYVFKSGYKIWIHSPPQYIQPKKGEVEDIAAAAAEGADESSGGLVLTRSKSDNHYLVPCQQGSNIPAKIHNDKSVLKNCYTQMGQAMKRRLREKMATASCNHS